MTDLSKRSTRLRFGTEDEVREQGRYRKIIVEARPRYAIIKASGIHREYTIEWSAIFSLAVKQAVAAEKAEKRRKK